MTPTYLSHSQLYLYGTCQRKYELHYIEKVVVPGSGEMVRGSAYHKAIEFAYRIKRDYNGEIPTEDAVLQVFSDEWDKSLSNKIIIDEDGQISIPAIDFKDKDPGKLKDDGVTLLKIYYHGLYQQTTPVAVEVKKSAEYNGVNLFGIIDLITDTGAVIDHKFTAKAYSEQQIATNTQSSFYGLLLGQDNIDFWIHQAIARAKPDIVPTLIHRNSDDLNWMGELACKTWQQIQSGLFLPNPFGWWCGPDECQYYAYCHMPSGF